MIPGFQRALSATKDSPVLYAWHLGHAFQVRKGVLSAAPLNGDGTVDESGWYIAETVFDRRQCEAIETRIYRRRPATSAFTRFSLTVLALVVALALIQQGM